MAAPFSATDVPAGQPARWTLEDPLENCRSSVDSASCHTGARSVAGEDLVPVRRRSLESLAESRTRKTPGRAVSTQVENALSGAGLRQYIEGWPRSRSGPTLAELIRNLEAAIGNWRVAWTISRPASLHSSPP